jgi:LEA14-like dessication related protein
MAFMAVWVFAGCQALQNIVKSPSVQMERAALKSTSLFQGDLEFTFNVSNPNPIGARLDGFSYQLAIEGKKMLEGQQAQGIGLPAMGSKSVTVPITVNYMESFDSLLDFFRKDSLTYEISGTFQIGLFTLPFSHKDVITLPKPPSVRVKGVSVTSMSFVGAKLAMDLEVSQEGKTSIDLKKINYAVSLGGIRLFDGQSENIILSDDATSKIVTVPLSIDFLSLGKSAIALFSKGAIDYELTGSMEFEVPNLGVKTFPFTKTGNTDLIR